MVFRHVSTTMLQSPQRARWRESSWARSRDSSPSRNSDKLRITSLQTKLLPLAFLEVLAEQFAGLEARSEQPRLHRWNREAHHLRRLLGREVLHIAQDENRAELRLELRDRLVQDLLQ